jgi:hypothetical protein
VQQRNLVTGRLQPTLSKHLPSFFKIGYFESDLLPHGFSLETKVLEFCVESVSLKFPARDIPVLDNPG